VPFLPFAKYEEQDHDDHAGADPDAAILIEAVPDPVDRGLQARADAGQSAVFAKVL